MNRPANDERRRTDVWDNLTLVRHGESTANEVNRFAGALDVPLSSLGLAQARRAAQSWDGQPFDQVYVSPMVRTRETACRLLRQIGGGTPPDWPIRIDQRLVERDFGRFTLQNKTRLQQRIGLEDYEAALYTPADHLHEGESFEAFRGRLLGFLKHELYPRLARGERVLVVAHKYVIELMARLILRLREDEGFDLRLPNGQLIAGGRLDRYVAGESPRGNRLRDWLVLRHSAVLSLAAGAGLATNALFPDWSVGTGWLIALLMFATTIALAQLALQPPNRLPGDPILSPLRLAARFVLLPWALAAALLAWPTLHDALSVNEWQAALLLIGAPAANSALVLSRASGGMVLPVVYAILISTLISVPNLALLIAPEAPKAFAPAASFGALAVLTLLIPLGIAQLGRQVQPIWTARQAERQGAWAVLALAAFVFLSFQNIPLDSFWPHGLLALALTLLLRLAALLATRWDSLYGLDDYFGAAYPNAFLAVLLANFLGNAEAVAVATWFGGLMFALSPLDDLLIRHLRGRQPMEKLRAYLRAGEASPLPQTCQMLQAASRPETPESPYADNGTLGKTGETS